MSNAPPPPGPFSNAEITEEIFDLRTRYAGQDKKLSDIKFDLEVYTRKQDTQTKKIKDSLAVLIDAFQRMLKQPPDPHSTPTRGWSMPKSCILQPLGNETEPPPKIKPEAPRFNGDNASEWIRKVQRYFNHHYTPLADRIYLSSYLFDHPASSWLTYWEDNCQDKTWEDFLLAVKHGFDPDLCQREFEDIMQKVSNVGEETLTSLFVAGLQDSIKLEL